MGVVGNKVEGSKVQLGDCAVKFSKSVYAIWGSMDDNHGSKVPGLQLAT